MLIPTLIMSCLAISLFFIALYRGKGEQTEAFRSTLQLSLSILPLLIASFLVAGFMKEFVGEELISKWIGSGSGFKGIMIGSLAGGLAPGGPYVSLPIVAGLLEAGAGTGTMVSFLTAWSLWAFNRLPMEIGIVGWRFTAIRMLSTFFFPPIAGLIAHLLTRSR